MPYHIYTTPGFIVGSKPYGESGKFFLVFTRELGMVGATAQGIRLSKSKLRYHVSDFSYNLFSFVRGKEMWRMTGVNDIDQEKIKDHQNKKTFINILLLLARLLSGEEKNEILFNIVERFYIELCSRNRDTEIMEYITVFRILDCLGYIKEKRFAIEGYSDEIIEEVKNNKKVILEEINDALRESQL